MIAVGGATNPVKFLATPLGDQFDRDRPWVLLKLRGDDPLEVRQQHAEHAGDVFVTRGREHERPILGGEAFAE